MFGVKETPLTLPDGRHTLSQFLPLPNSSSIPTTLAQPPRAAWADCRSAGFARAELHDRLYCSRPRRYSGPLGQRRWVRIVRGRIHEAFAVLRTFASHLGSVIAGKTRASSATAVARRVTAIYSGNFASFRSRSSRLNMNFRWIGRSRLRSGSLG